MEVVNRSAFEQISTRTEVNNFLGKVLATSLPFAIWKLPQDQVVYYLFDVSGPIKPKGNFEIESLNESFVINSYTNCHPVKPLVLSGDIMIKVIDNEVNLSISPTVSSEKLDRFFQTISATESSSKKELKVLVDQESALFEHQVSKAIDFISSGHSQKIVLSRFEDIDLAEDFDPLAAFDRLVEKYPNAFCHLTQSEHGLWLGASPERLIAIEENKMFKTDALAGTQTLSEGTSLMDIGWTQKEIEEQAMVSRYIINCLKKIRLREFEEIGPRTIQAGNLAHLRTEFVIDMEATNTLDLGSTMLELLHPTSAVCGFPRDTANEFIKETENYDRELYSGFLGPVGFKGNSQLFVNLRCMQIVGDIARLYAGAGITENSNPAKEFAETQHKLQTMLNVLQQ